MYITYDKKRIYILFFYLFLGILNIIYRLLLEYLRYSTYAEIGYICEAFNEGISVKRIINAQQPSKDMEL